MSSKSRYSPKQSLDPNKLASQAQAKLQKAVVLHQQGQFAQAEAIYAEVLRMQPNNHDALHLLGVIAIQRKDLERAANLIEKAIEIHPGSADMYFNYGTALMQLNRFEAALQNFEKAIALRPGYAEAHYSKGNALKKRNQPEAALQSYEQAISLKPDFAEAHVNRGNVLHQRNQFDAALQSYDNAIAINPRYAEAYYGRGLTLKKLKHLDAAIENFDKAIAMKPAYIAAHAERGNALLELKQPHAALDSYDTALSHVPDHPEVTAQKSIALLLTADFNRGWQLYEWRWKCESFPSRRRDFSQPLWLGGETLEGKTILLHCEQGLGDTIQFCRYVKVLSRLGARIILEVQKPLVGLLAGLDGVSQVVEKGAPLPSFDCHCPFMSLPLAFKTNMQTIPSEPVYLTAPALKIALWRQKLGAQTQPRVGLAWSGSPTHKNDINRSIALSELVRHLPADFQFVSLQKDVRDADKATLQQHPGILHFGDEITDFTDTAALCELMDLVISVDTSVAHLSGALGKQTWVLLPYVPDWRWLLDRNDSPWYPAMKLYRQPSAGDWLTLFTRVSVDLKTVHPTLGASTTLPM